MRKRLAMTNNEVKEMMSPLTQEHLETRLLQPRNPEAPLVVIYFTAKWCNPCKNLKLAATYHFRNDIKWYVCDVDDNGYSLGFCGGRQIPSFAAIVQGVQLPMITSADYAVVCKWLNQLPTLPAKPGVALPTVEPPKEPLSKPPIVPFEAPMPPPPPIKKADPAKVTFSFGKKV